jgi:DNA/RNA-binding domain of Phe-tRNA-synthetase-like protein
MNISVDPHPLLDPVLLLIRWPAPLADLDTLTTLSTWFSDAATPPLDRPDEVKPAVRDLLRHGGFKPSGRSKPASEYLVKAAERGVMGSINPAVDCCNVASLWSGLPISVVDVDKGTGPWRIGLAEPDTVYVFNPSGQEINISGLISLFDADGACGGPVKDSQRTKTHDGTTLTLSVVWGTQALPGRSEATAEWYGELMSSLGAQVERVTPTRP